MKFIAGQAIFFISPYLSAMRTRILALVTLTCLVACHPRPVATPDGAPEMPLMPPPPALVTRIAFGSCAEQDKPQPILKQVLLDEPDLFIYLGDNIYGDTEDMERLQQQYAMLGAKPEFKQLRAKTHTIATWDDHDYGANDAGRHYPQKAASKEIFLDFWLEPSESPRRQHAGIYHSTYYGPAEKRVQVILLDTRTFRDNLLPSNGTPPWKNDYRPNLERDSTFLGEAQWQWLAEELKQPAVFRIIASSNQFCHDYNGYESWTNVPNEQKRMIELLRDVAAEGVVFISGDVHWGELSKRKAEGLYPIYDMTSSGITETWHKVEPNAARVGDAEPANNYGLFTIDWQDDPVLTMALKTADGKSTVTQVVRRSELAIYD